MILHAEGENREPWDIRELGMCKVILEMEQGNSRCRGPHTCMMLSAMGAV